MCATQRLHVTKLLLHFAPAEFQRKALGKPKRNCGEKGDASICISHLSHTRAGAMLVTWNGLLGLGSSYPADPNLGVNATILRHGGGEPCLLWAAHLECCSFCPHPPCCSPGAVLVGTAVQRDDPCWSDSELWHQCLAPGQGECLAEAQNVPWQDPGAASLLNIDGYCLHGGLGPPALQIVFPCAGPDRVPHHSQQSSQAGQGAQQAGDHWPKAVPGPLICWCVALFKDSGEEKEEVLGFLE